ncbi:MAG: hypothetical protein IPJ06_14390 [Saprospiraceae bacterium]|nr:hypothetical protein [Saprospiraceae bacterium]
MRRNYAAALQDDAQQVLNTMLKSGLTELVLAGAFEERIYEKYPLYLGRAAELLGKSHYLYPILMARQAFFKGKIAKEKAERKQHFLQALEWQPGMPHAMLELGVNEGHQNLDSAKVWLLNSVELLPGWVLPYVKLSNIYSNAGRFDDAFAQLEIAEQVDSNSVLVWYERASLNMQLHFYEVAEPILQKVIKNTSDEVCFPCAHMALGRLYMQRAKPKEAQTYVKSALLCIKTASIPKASATHVLMSTSALDIGRWTALTWHWTIFSRRFRRIPISFMVIKTQELFIS